MGVNRFICFENGFEGNPIGITFFSCLILDRKISALSRFVSRLDANDSKLFASFFISVSSFSRTKKVLNQNQISMSNEWSNDADSSLFYLYMLTTTKLMNLMLPRNKFRG